MLHRFEPPSPQTTLSCRLPLVEGPQHAATETSSELWLTPSIGRTAYFFNRYAYEAQPVNSSSANLEAATFADMNSTGDWRAGGSRAWNPNASWRRMSCRRSLPPAYRPRPARTSQCRQTRRDVALRCRVVDSSRTFRYRGEATLRRRRARGRGRRRCERCSRDPAQLRVRFRKPRGGHGHDHAASARFTAEASRLDEKQPDVDEKG
jgi:hypothetical protein